MISSEEINAVGKEIGVGSANVERDYVFGWLLAGLYATDNELATQLILKGGNAFRKGYFRDARFSKDLDFSLQNDLNVVAFERNLRQACEFAASMSGVEFDYDRQNVKEKRGVDAEQRAYESKVYFRGFYGEEECTISAKLDIREFDRIFLPIQSRSLIHAYSDGEECVALVQCMKLEELLASKLKALLQREHSPDLFDFVHGVFVQNSLNVDRLEVASTFLRKTIYARNPHAAFDLLVRRPWEGIKDAWARYLVLPKSVLLAFDDAERLFREGMETLFALVGVSPRAAAMYASRVAADYFPVESRNILMEAGRMQRLVEITYGGHTRVMEPYALSYKRRKDGVAREYFYGYDRTGGASGAVGIKSMTNDKMSSIRILDEEFQPRYPVELAKAGEFFGKSTFSSGSVGTRRPTQARPRAIFGRPNTVEKTYTLTCPLCQKQFRRSSMTDTTLHSHKNPWNLPCSGTHGYWT